MKKIGRNLLEALYFIMCFAPVPLLIGYALVGEGVKLLIAVVATLPLALVISLLPGRLGAREAQADVFVERASSGGDPDPDRSLRRDTHEAPVKGKKGFPLRLLVCVAGMAAVWLGLLLGPIDLAADLALNETSDEIRGLFAHNQLLSRALISLVPAVMLPLSVRFCADGSAMDVRNAGAGVTLYLITGVASLLIRSDALTRSLALCGAVFLAMTLLILNNRAMYIGASVREGVRPPKAMRQRNRVLTVLLLLLAALVVGFSWLKEKVQWLWGIFWRAVLKVMMWLSSLGGGTPMGDGGPAGDMSGGGFGMEPGEPAPFWEYMTYVAYVIAAVALVFLLYLMFRRIYQLLRELVKRIAAWMGRFAQSVGEEYHDEQESLLDWDETRREVASTLRKRFTSLFHRDKKWDDMDAREKTRHLVKTLYRRARLPADGRTLRETLPLLKTSEGESLVNTYELARYSPREPDGDTVEALRKDIRP